MKKNSSKYLQKKKLFKLVYVVINLSMNIFRNDMRNRQQQTKTNFSVASVECFNLAWAVIRTHRRQNIVAHTVNIKTMYRISRNCSFLMLVPWAVLLSLFSCRLKFTIHESVWMTLYTVVHFKWQTKDENNMKHKKNMFKI